MPKLATKYPLPAPTATVLWEVTKARLLRYRCHTGHAYKAGGLLHNSHQTLEETLWVALLSGIAVRSEGNTGCSKLRGSKKLRSTSIACANSCALACEYGGLG